MSQPSPSPGSPDEPRGIFSGRGADRVAAILAIGISIALTLFAIGVGLNAIMHGTPLSENATQVLVASFSGIIGGLAGYLGGRSTGSGSGE